MANTYFNIAKLGFEEFSQYGKFIGTRRSNGISYFKGVFGNNTVITGVKDGKVVQRLGREAWPLTTANRVRLQIESIKGRDLILTTNENFQTGATRRYLRTNNLAYQRTIDEVGDTYASVTHRRDVPKTIFTQKNGNQWLNVDKGYNYIEAQGYVMGEHGKEAIKLNEQGACMPKWCDGFWDYDYQNVCPSGGRGFEENIAGAVLTKLNDFVSKFTKYTIWRGN